MIKKIYILILTAFIFLNFTPAIFAQEESAANYNANIFDDKMLLSGYAQRLQSNSKEFLLELIKDDTVNSFQMAAAIRVFKEKFSQEIVSQEKNRVEKTFLRRLARTDSPFVQVEIMSTLCRLDRYQYFKSLIPALIQKLDHYNPVVNEIAFENINYIIESGNNRTREARIIFNTLRKVLFLSRKRLENVTEPGPRLKQKIKLVRWSIKILGNEELKRLPKEVLNLL